MTTVRIWLHGYRQDVLELGAWLGAQPARAAAFWGAFEDHAQVQIIGLGLLAIGFIIAGLAPLAALVPGAVLVLVSLGFSLKRRAP